MKCSKLVLKKKSSYGYKVYVNAASAKKAGAKACGGNIRAVSVEEGHWASSNGWNGEGRYVSRFEGVNLACEKCGDVVKSFSIDDLEQMVEKEHEQSFAQMYHR